MLPSRHTSPPSPYTTLFRSVVRGRLRDARLEGPALETGRLSPPRGSGGAGRRSRSRRDDSRAPGLHGVAPHRAPRRGVATGGRGAAARDVSRDGRAARGGRRAVRDRAREERERVLDAVSRRAWLGAWERAVRRAGERVSAAVDAELEHAARRVRMPRLLRRGRLLSPSEQRAIAARLASGGEGLIAALDALDAAAAQARDASVLDKVAHAEWQEALRTAARRLEAAWLSLEAGVADEQRRWAGEVEAVARWRPPL